MLDGRAIEAQIKQAEASSRGDEAQLEQAERDVAALHRAGRQNATTPVTLNNAKPRSPSPRRRRRPTKRCCRICRFSSATRTIRAPITGRISAAAVKAGNIVRAADLRRSPPSSRPRRSTSRSRCRSAAAGRARGDRGRARPRRGDHPGRARARHRPIAMIENTVDAATGMVNVRATMPNEDELLWPGRWCRPI